MGFHPGFSLTRGCMKFGRNQMTRLSKDKNLFSVVVLILGLGFSSKLSAQCEPILSRIQENSESSKMASLIKRLRDNSISISQEAQRDLIEIGAPAVSALLELIQSNDYWDQNRAASVLGAIGDSRASAPLIQLLENKSVDSSAKVIFVMALGRIRDASAVPALMDALRSSELNEAATAALKNIGEPAFQSLLQVLSGQNPSKSAAAAQALGEFKDDRAVDDLIGALGDQRFRDSWEVRLNAVVALRKIAHPSALPALLNTAKNDPHPQIQKVALKASESMGRWE